MLPIAKFLCIVYISILLLESYSNPNDNESEKSCDSDVAPSEPIAIDLSHTAESQTQSSPLADNIDVSECVSNQWLNQNGTLDGYHVLCVDPKPNQLNVEYFINGINDSATNGNIALSTDAITDIFALRLRLQTALSIIPRPPGFNEWTMYNSNGQKIETLADFIRSGTVLIYEGGIFIWPPIHIGFTRQLQIKNADTSDNTAKPYITYKLETLSCHPIVILVDNFIPHSYCDHIKTLSEPFMKDSGVSHMHNTQGSARKWRTSTTHWLRPSTDDNVVNAINNYTEQILHIPMQHQELMQVLRYKETQQYDSHWDYFDPQLYKGTAQESKIRYGKNRAVTLYWYLSKVPEGGGGYTFFPMSGKLPRPRSLKLVTIDDCHTGGGLVVKPKKGTAIIFYSAKPNGEIDPESLHGACPVVGKDNVKWGANKWVWTQPFR